jgi:hypothetical protein
MTAASTAAPRVAVKMSELSRGDLVVINAPDIGGSAIGLYVVQHLFTDGATALVLPAVDLAYSRHLRIRAEHVVSHIKAAGAVNAAALAPFVAEVSVSPAAAMAERRAELEAAEALIPRVAVSVPSSDGPTPFEVSRRDGRNSITRRYTPVDGLLWMPTPDAFGFVEASGYPYATPAQVAAWKERRRKAGASEEAPSTVIAGGDGLADA